MAEHIQWGNIVLVLDHKELRTGFALGRQWYFADIAGKHGRKPEEPQRAIQLNANEILSICVACDEQGHYHFDEEGQEHLVEYLGIYLGYLSGPLCAETPEERQTREQEEIRTTETLPILTISRV